MISDELIRRIKERFPHANPTFGKPPEPSVVIPAVHPEVGEIKIYDEGCELTLVAGRFTHGHFSDFDSQSTEEKERNIVDQTVWFLDRLFADQIILWGSHASGGGWYLRESEPATIPEIEQMKKGKQLYVWSGPLHQATRSRC